MRRSTRQAIRRPSELADGDKVVVEMMTGKPARGKVEERRGRLFAVFPNRCKNGRRLPPIVVELTQKELDDQDKVWYKA